MSDILAFACVIFGVILLAIVAAFPTADPDASPWTIGGWVAAGLAFIAAGVIIGVNA